MEDFHVDGLTLLKRWHEVVHDSMVNVREIPRPAGGQTVTLWEHRTVEVFAHITYGQVYGGCAYLNWYRDGRRGKVQDVVCDGKIREPQHYDLETIEWQGREVELPEYVECRIGELFAAAEDWSHDFLAGLGRP